jgi:hypothetical protein
VRSLHNLLNVKLGIDREHLLMARIDLVAAGYSQAALPALCERIRDRLKTIPGVRDAAVSNDGLSTGDEGDHISIDGGIQRPDDDMGSYWTLIGPGYLNTLGISMRPTWNAAGPSAWSTRRSQSTSSGTRARSVIT